MTDEGLRNILATILVRIATLATIAERPDNKPLVMRTLKALNSDLEVVRDGGVVVINPDTGAAEVCGRETLKGMKGAMDDN